MNENEFDKFFTYYYQTQPTDNIILEALEYFIHYVNLTTAENVSLSKQLFSRIGELKPGIIRDYEKIYSHSKEGRQFIFSVLQNIGDSHTKEFIQKCLNQSEFKDHHNTLKESLNKWAPRSLNAFNHPIKCPNDLDVLWAEFIITGNPQSVIQIIDVLEWPDIVRKKIVSWLQSKSRFQFFFNLRRKDIAQSLNTSGVILEDNLENILSPQDMDCYVKIDLKGNINQQRFNKFESLLPFNLTQKDLDHIHLKSRAFSSLASNSCQHPIVLETIDTEALKRIDKCRMSLLEISAKAYLSKNNKEKAVNKLYDSLFTRPIEKKEQQERANSSYEILTNLPSCNEEIDTALVNEHNKLKSSVIQTNNEINSYYSKITEDNTLSSFATWQLEYMKPNRFRLYQTIGHDIDEWLLFGYDFFSGPVFDRVFEFNELKKEVLGLIGFFELQNHIETIKNFPINSAFEYKLDGKIYILLNYFLPRDDVLDNVGIWVEKGSSLIVKVEGFFSTPQYSKHIIQLFACQNENILITPPAFKLPLGPYKTHLVKAGS
jgi:hypothetical protein